MNGMLVCDNSLSLFLSNNMYELGVFSSSVHAIFHNLKHSTTIVNIIKDYITNMITKARYEI